MNCLPQSRVRLLGSTLAFAIAPMPAMAQQAPAERPLHRAVGAPDALKLTLDIRGRFEAIDGQFRALPVATAEQALLFRTLLFAEYDTGPVRIGGELQDSRSYFENPRGSVSTSEVNAFEPIRAYLGFDLEDDAQSGRTTLDIGRQVLTIGSFRLVGRAGFPNATNAFTGAHLHHESKRGRFDAFWTMPLTRLPADKGALVDNAVALDRESTDLQFFAASWERHLAGGGPTVEAYLYGLTERDAPGRPTPDRRLATPGVRLVQAPQAGRIDYDVEAIAQFGERRTNATEGAPRQRVEAGYVHAELGRRFAGDAQPRVAVLVDYGSGDGPGDTYGRFDSLYGLRVPDFGSTSYFGPLSRSNAIDLGLRAQARPAPHANAQLTYHAAWAARSTDAFANTGVRDRAGTSGRFAGHQIDARASFDVAPGLAQIEVGAAALLKGRLLTDAPNANDAGDTAYAYAQFNLSL